MQMADVLFPLRHRLFRQTESLPRSDIQAVGARLRLFGPYLQSHFQRCPPS